MHRTSTFSILEQNFSLAKCKEDVVTAYVSTVSLKTLKLRSRRRGGIHSPPERWSREPPCVQLFIRPHKQVHTDSTAIRAAVEVSPSESPGARGKNLFGCDKELISGSPEPRQRWTPLTSIMLM
ncbi:hypothetical protein DPX16_8460 [Anabarilius grahami]|uniref:Uncharacterized protein n=1 Tax=Anabarilius grahami TaxID=495550 RepID=A0A3N0Z342_ANAGA|nr:hypothetical protein DPX16_8460 [Anabarilius grahami]